MNITIKKTVTIAALLAITLFIACQNPSGGTRKKPVEPEITYIIYSTTVNGTMELSFEETKQEAEKNLKAKEGEVVAITAKPSSAAYRLVSGSIRVETAKDTIPVDVISETEKQGKYEFEMPDANVVVSVLFSKIPTGEGGEPLAPLTKNQVFSGGELNNAVLTGANNRHVPWYCDDEGRQQGSQAIRVGPDEFSQNGAGFSITRDAGHEINFTEVNALSFWARSPDAIRIQAVQLGTGTNSITYTGENGNGIDVDPEWKRYLIPIPGNRSITVNEAFTLRIDRRESARTLYIDDIEYITTAVSLSEIVLKTPDIISVGDPVPVANLIRGMKAAYTVGEATASLIYGNIDFSIYHNTFTPNATGGASFSNNTVTANALGGTYNLSVALDGVTKSISGSISASRFITIENCTPVGIKTIEGNSGQPGTGGYYATSWDAGFEEADGRVYLKVLNRRWDGNRDWDREGTVGRKLPTAANLSTYDKIVFSIRSAAPGLGYHVRIWQGTQKYSTVVHPITNYFVWEEVAIPLEGSFFRIDRNGDVEVMSNVLLTSFNNITQWEIGTDNNNYNENYMYVGPIKASQ